MSFATGLIKNGKLILELQELADNGSSLFELLDFTYEYTGTEPYGKYIVLGAFRPAFNLGIHDLNVCVFACHVFGGRKSVSEIEDIFRKRLEEVYFPFR